jgi:CO/xanthine dehydrogenase FAD-binding subunit
VSARGSSDHEEEGELRESDTQVLRPESIAQAVEEFGDGRDVTVFAGGTILMPEIAYGRYPRGGRTLMLDRAGLEQITRNSTITLGAMVSLSAIAGAGVEPLASAAADIADPEIRAQATLGGNLNAPPGTDSPRGDLQAPLLALDARVRSTGPGGERAEAVEEFLNRAGDEPRLVLEVECEQPARAAYVSQRRAHAHSYAVMSVACAELSDGVRVAAGGVAPRAVHLHAVERALADGASAADAAAAAGEGIDPADDALATAWYRREVLPVLVNRALQQLQGG